jgi:4-alpha-glucanotransferase
VLWHLGDHELFGANDFTKALPMRYVDAQTWEALVLVPHACAPDKPITYNYILQNPDGSLIRDWGRDKQINLAEFTNKEDVLLIDSWNSASFYENVFYTEAFQEVLLKANYTEVSQSPPNQVTHIFRVKAPLLKAGETLCLLGDVPQLGEWSTDKPLLLSREPGKDFFSTAVNLSGSTFPAFYKYGIFNVTTREFLRFEAGPNSVLYTLPGSDSLTIVNDGFAQLPNTTWKGSGIAIPVFSLRSERSFSVGEFSDLKLLADWCKTVGLKLIQILPINDTIATNTWGDSYPYAAISAFALHPQYIDLSRVAEGPNKALLKNLEPRRREFNALEALDYEAVLKTKLDFLRQIFPSQKAKTFKRKDYTQFYNQNSAWLVPYAAFAALRDKYGTSHFDQWPACRRFHEPEIEQLRSSDPEFKEAAEFYYWVQFHLHLQLRDAAEYLHSLGIILKGDIAIGVYRYGADAWEAPDLYHMDMQAGAPPDPFAAKGQNWGFPTYNWQRMQETGFAWWKRRFAQMAYYFDAFRIDHILGFFRIWSIPTHAVEGILGYFVPALPVRAAEFAERGIAFDRQRFIKPFINDLVLAEVFGAEVEFIKREFLDAERFGMYSLKPEYTTQRQVEQKFSEWEKSEKNERLKIGVFDLISNVLLFESEGSAGQEFHFRLGMENTPSFKALDRDTQGRLKDLYVDYFYRRQDAFWMREAMQKLPALKQVTNMLVCGEDLGMVPACVPDVMKQLGLLSLEIQRMPKDPSRDFSSPKDAPYLSVVTPSTHDMSTIRGWWEEDTGLTQKFFNTELRSSGDAPRTCTPEVARLIIQQHLASRAMWSIFQFQDLLAISGSLRRDDIDAERINIPAIPKHYWRYRMHLPLELLAGRKQEDPRTAEVQSLNTLLRTMLAENHR